MHAAAGDASFSGAMSLRQSGLLPPHPSALKALEHTIASYGNLQVVT